ncbi:LysR substrate-binding domain-containing protein [Rouxiella sp. Mn2063]|uniref:LysR substrate-binding domain-containing protein n=1 Tax=Rouxiella sp. Mn2063 TaxID=3395262 RepID=UPI003BEE2391
MFIRQLSYLIALDKHRHFARAADSCHVSQPSLSVAIRQLEDELGITIIQRARRFIGFTKEGEQVLAWARKTVASLDSLRQDAAFARNNAGGHLAIGAVPSALFAATLLVKTYRKIIPNLTIEICSLSTSEIHQRLKQHQLHLGMAYSESVSEGPFEHIPLYHERFVLLSGPDAEMKPGATLRWEDVAHLPLCLFSPDMNNRRIINEAFAKAGVVPNVVIETNTASVFLDLVSTGELYSIAPVSAVPGYFLHQGICMNPMSQQFGSPIYLLRLHQENASSLLNAAWGMAETIDLQEQLDDALAEGAYRH